MSIATSAWCLKSVQHNIIRKQVMKSKYIPNATTLQNSGVDKLIIHNILSLSVTSHAGDPTTASLSLVCDNLNKLYVSRHSSIS